MERTDCDVLIIGAGLLGCAAARALRRYELSVVVLEKAPDVSTGISKANSGIIYAGYDDAPGSLKAEMVVRACKRLPELCSELDVHYRRSGSIMIGFGERAEMIIRKKYETGLSNGSEGLELLSGREVLEREPLIAPDVCIGLYAPGTATVDPWELCIALYENASSNGARFFMDSEVISIRRTADGFLTGTAGRSFSSRVVINCAGLSSDRLREMTEEPLIRIVPNASDYFVLGAAGERAPSSVIFHEPEYKVKGLTLIPTVNGEILAGSTERDDPGVSGMPASAEGLRRIAELCRRVVPGMPLSPVIRSFAAVRPNPFEVRRADGDPEGCSDAEAAAEASGDASLKKGPSGYIYGPDNVRYAYTGRRLRDFNILEENGLFSLIGIKTPGLSCCVELGEYITDHVISYLNSGSGTGSVRPDQSSEEHTEGPGIELNGSWDPSRRGIRRFSDVPGQGLADAVRDEPGLGRIVCGCRRVSESEIREAVRRGASTLDGVKRRTGALMGHCQGSKCLSRVLKIMAEELGTDISKIVKESADSAVL